MKNSLRLGTLTLLTGVALAVAARTAEARLTVGDPAPKLQTGMWVQGDPVTAFDTNHVFLIDFWATWCGPCRTSIPHLNELQEKFKDQGLIVIGQDVGENDSSNVAAFVKKMGGQMIYRVALDDRSRETNGIMAATWMGAAEQNNLPASFIVNQHGIIAWIGHPMALNEQILADVLADKFDVAGYAAGYEQQRDVEKQRAAYYKNLQDAMRQKNWDAAESALTQLENSVPGPMRFHYGTTRLQILLAREDYAAAGKLAESLSDGHKDDVAFQNEIAWTMVTCEGLGKSGLLAAEKIAERANAVAPDKTSAVLDTLSRIQFLLGKKKEAIASEQKALNVAANETEKSYLTRALADYQQGKLPVLKE